METLALKIDGQWAVLGPSGKISIERTSSLWNESGSFSYPFTIPYKENRHILGIFDLPESNARLNEYKSNFELYCGGLLMLSGICNLKSDEISEYIEITLGSGKNSFYDSLSDLNCREVTQSEDVVIGKLEAVTGESRNYWQSTYIYNTDIPYPNRKFCNVNVIMNPVTATVNGVETTTQAIGLYNRAYSGVCYFMLYFIDCLFTQFGISITKNEMLNLEDFKRMAFFSTRCDFTYKASSESSHNYVATSKNFPDETVKNVLTSIQNAFGVRFIYNEINNTCEICFIKNILTNNTVRELDVKVQNINKVQIAPPYVILSFGEEDDTTFKYDNYDNAKVIADYNELVDLNNAGLEENDINCYVDSKTGNAYRVKVDESDYDNAALFEVAAFNDYAVGNKDNDEEKLDIKFKPVIVTDITPSDIRKKHDFTAQGAVYVDYDIKGIVRDSNRADGYTTPRGSGSTSGSTGSTSGRTSLNSEYLFLDWAEASVKADCGFQIGIMRGTGSDASYAIIDSSIDVGGQTWVATAGRYPAFTSDCIDLFGRRYDYNGVGEGTGVDDNQLISLKPIATKKAYSAQILPDRGLVPKFLSEYMHFLANRKLIRIIARMTVAQLVNIDWSRKYRIGEYIGFINKLSFDIDNNGLSEVEIELYMI